MLYPKYKYSMLLEHVAHMVRTYGIWDVHKNLTEQAEFKHFDEAAECLCIFEKEFSEDFHNPEILPTLHSFGTLPCTINWEKTKEKWEWEFDEAEE